MGQPGICATSGRGVLEGPRDAARAPPGPAYATFSKREVPVSGRIRLIQGAVGVYQADTGDVGVSALYQADMELI